MPDAGTDRDRLLARAHELAVEHLDGIAERHVGAIADADELRAALDTGLTDDGVPADVVLEELVRGVGPGLIASPGPRYFGFVVGGALPVSVAVEWMAAAWDQMAGLFVSAPAAAVVEEVAAGWLLDVLQLPSGAGVGFVTGAQMANTTALAAARGTVLRRAGWDVEADGLQGAPKIDVLVGERAHVTIEAALRLLGLGGDRVHRVPADDQGRMLAPALEQALTAGDGPAIVCAQAGEVNTGAFDPFEEIAEAAAQRGAWLHVDGAFGLWAAASPSLRHHVRGVERADSWAVDAHKWLNVPYDSGLAIVADAEAHRRAMGLTAAYLLPPPGAARDPYSYTPEASRRARGFAVYATLRTLGRDGVAELVEGCCAHARQLASHLADAPGLRLLNDVVLNQVLVALDAPPDRLADVTAKTIDAIQADGTCWVGGTDWNGNPAIRVSISNWSTTAEDISASAEAIARAADQSLAS